MYKHQADYLKSKIENCPDYTTPSNDISAGVEMCIEIINECTEKDYMASSMKTFAEDYKKSLRWSSERALPMMLELFDEQDFSKCFVIIAELYRTKYAAWNKK